MSITDELRKEANKESWVHCTTLRDIADRIDERHERALAEQFESLTVDMKPMTDENMAEHGWVKLPKDADGVPIQLGDYLESDEYGGKQFPCRGLNVEVCTSGKRWTVCMSYDSYSGTSEYTSANRCHHVKPPTVEDVLREEGGRVRSEAVTEAWEFYRDNCPGFKEPMRKKFRELDEYVSRLEAALGREECKASKQRSMDGKVRGWQCHGCGAVIVTAPSGEEWPELPNYCPNCGRKVVK